MKRNCITALVGVVAFVGANARGADELAARCADRAAVERVYYQHRTGEKPPFEQVLPPDLIRRSVERGEQREAALRRTYSVEITRAQLDAEIKRIEANTRAPEILAELKGALGDEEARFARTVARPALVERELRARFENDDAVHAVSRREGESMRERCLKAKAAGASVREILDLLKQVRAGQTDDATWNLASRAARAGDSPEEPRAYFEDLPLQLQQTLAAQLRQPGDISAVVETPDNFLLFVCTSKTAAELKAVFLSIAKLNLETWLNSQPQPQP